MEKQHIAYFYDKKFVFSVSRNLYKMQSMFLLKANFEETDISVETKWSYKKGDKQTNIKFN